MPERAAEGGRRLGLLLLLRGSGRHWAPSYTPFHDRMTHLSLWTNPGPSAQPVRPWPSLPLPCSGVAGPKPSFSAKSVPWSGTFSWVPACPHCGLFQTSAPPRASLTLSEPLPTPCPTQTQSPFISGHVCTWTLISHLCSQLPGPRPRPEAHLSCSPCHQAPGRTGPHQVVTTCSRQYLMRLEKVPIQR